MALQSVPNCRARDPCFHNLKIHEIPGPMRGSCLFVCVYLFICLFGCLVVGLVGCLFVS